MARTSGKKDDLIKCEYCGEMYSTTYKHCPFCDESGTDWEEAEEGYEEEPVRPVGGKRLASNSGGGYHSPSQRPGRNRRISPWSILGIILSLALIIAAVCIVVSIFRSITGRGPKPTPTPTPPSMESQEVVEPTPDGTEEPGETDVPEPTPTVEATVPPVGTKPTSFTISGNGDISFFNPGEQYTFKVTMVPADATADVIWKSSDPNIASVSWNGKVTAVSGGTVTITATIEGVGEQKCIVRCSFTGTAKPATSNEVTSSAGGLTLSREDFTLEKIGDSWRLTVSGTDSSITWSSSNEAVATVSSNGTVTSVGKGNCTITAEVDGVKLSCIVRCTGKPKE